MPEQAVTIPTKRVVYSLPDWFIKTVEPYAESFTPVSLFNVAICAFLQSDSETWFDYVEDIAETSFGNDPDGDVLVILAVELLEELSPLLTTYFNQLIPLEERVIMDVEPFDDFSFMLVWDEGIIQ